MTPDAIRASVDERIAALQRALDDTAVGRGGRALEYAAFLLGRLVADRDNALKLIQAERGQADPIVEQITGRSTSEMMHVTLQDLEQLGIYIAMYGEAVGRTDLPVGLTDLIQTVVADLLQQPPIGQSVDALIRTVPGTRYGATLLRAEAHATSFGPPLPVVFELPALDPANMMLAPIIAHEAAHLVEKLASLPTPDDAANKQIRAIFHDLPVEAGENQTRVRQNWSQKLTDWSSEVLADLIATRLCGPSVLLALLAHAPSMPRTSTSHPPTLERARWVRNYLGDLGWDPFLEEHCPGVLSELADQAQPQRSQEAAALVSALEILLPWMKAAAGDRCCALQPLEQERFAEAMKLLESEVPPVQLGGTADPILPWHAILVAWAAALRQHGDSMTGLITAAADRRRNAVVLKTVELSRVVTLWRDS
ncbi:hypothetical protein [Curtobacterium sp. L1-20]|uniref:hypothetical protein n=1 Tax=Curtobacterium sp. L1-20 TaxID=3138181 RepID=UPI003B5212FF